MKKQSLFFSLAFLFACTLNANEYENDITNHEYAIMLKKEQTAILNKIETFKNRMFNAYEKEELCHLVNEYNRLELEIHSKKTTLFPK